MCKMKINISHENGIRWAGGDVQVIPERLDAARETAKTLRENAREADEQAVSCGNFRRKVLLRIAREARSLADKIEKQCDRPQRKVPT